MISITRTHIDVQKGLAVVTEVRPATREELYAAIWAQNTVCEVEEPTREELYEEIFAR